MDNRSSRLLEPKRGQSWGGSIKRRSLYRLLEPKKVSPKVALLSGVHCSQTKKVAKDKTES